MNRIKRISMELIEKYGEQLGDDFEKNKDVIKNVALIRSKRLQNQVAGYIAVYMKNQADSKQEGEAEEEVVEVQASEEGMEMAIEQEGGQETTDKEE